MTMSTESIDIKALENKLETLIELYSATKNENISLKNKQTELVREKAKLLEKTSLARSRIESMISRLKMMEQGT
jgi:cell division protein ZapB